MSRSSSLHAVGCVTAHKHEAEQSNLEKFLNAQKHNFDDESDEVEDEAKVLRNENHKRVNDMIQQARENLNKKVNCKKTPQKQNKNTAVTESEVVASCPENALDVLRKMERLRNEEDHLDFERLNVREEKTGQVGGSAFCKKPEENLEYFTGTKRSKNKVKQKKQEKTINLTDLDKTYRHDQYQQPQHQPQMAVDVPVSRSVNCWEKKRGSELFESKQQCLSEYNCAGTEQELLDRAIAESLKTHKAEIERNSYTRSCFIPDIKEFPEDNWDNEIDTTGYDRAEKSVHSLENKKKHTSIYLNEKLTDYEPSYGPVYANEISAMKSGLRKEKPSGSGTWEQCNYHGDMDDVKSKSRQNIKKESCLVDEVFIYNSDEEFDDTENACSDKPCKSVTNLANEAEWDKSVGSSRAALNKMQCKSQMDVGLKYKPMATRNSQKTSRTMEPINSTSREQWDNYVGNSQAAELKFRNAIDVDYNTKPHEVWDVSENACSVWKMQHKSDERGSILEMQNDGRYADYNHTKIEKHSSDNVQTVNVNQMGYLSPREMPQMKTQDENKQIYDGDCSPIEEFFKFEDIPAQEPENLPASSQPQSLPFHAVNPAVYAMLQALHQSMNVKPTDMQREGESMYANLPTPQNEDMRIQTKEREMLPAPQTKYGETQQQSDSMKTRTDAIVPGKQGEETPLMYPSMHAVMQQSMFERSLAELQARQFAMGYPWLYNNVMLNPFVAPFANPMLGMVPLQCPMPPNAAAMMMNNMPRPPTQMGADPTMTTSGRTTEAITGKGRGRIIM